MCRDRVTRGGGYSIFMPLLRSLLNFCRRVDYRHGAPPELGLRPLVQRQRTWGEARTSTPEKGEEYLRLCVESSELVFREIERTFAAMPLR